MIKIATTTRFEKEYKKLSKSGKDMAKLKTVMAQLAYCVSLEPRFRDHKLAGNFAGRRECHITPDWLLIYKKTDDEIIFERTGSHSELFG